MTLSVDFKKNVGKIKPVCLKSLPNLKYRFAGCTISAEASEEHILSMSKTYLRI